jgi:hypothetical protein
MNLRRLFLIHLIPLRYSSPDLLIGRETFYLHAMPRIMAINTPSLPTSLFLMHSHFLSLFQKHLLLQLALSLFMVLCVVPTLRESLGVNSSS